jgi:hypothetical protein
MAKKQLIDFVSKLKEAGINASLTKPRSQFLLPFQQPNQTTSIALNPYSNKKEAMN